MLYAMQGALITSYINHYDLHSAAQGATGSALSVGQAIALIILFWQAGKIAKPIILAIALAGIVVILFSISIMPPFVLLVLLTCMLGIMFGSIGSTSSSIIADLHDGDDSPKYMSRLHGVFGLAGLITPLFFRGLFTAGFYWNVSVRVTALVVVMIFVTYVILSRRSLKSITLAESGRQKITRSDFAAFFRRGSNILLIFCALFYGAHQSVIVVWIIRYVEVALETPLLAALSLSLFWAGVTISRLFMHRILPVSPIKVVLFGNLVSAIAMCVGILSGSGIVVICMAFVTGFSSGTTIPALLSACCAENDCNTLLPTNFINLALYSSLIVCPIIVGALEAYTSLNEAMYLAALFSLLCGILVYFYCRKTRKMSA